MIRCRAVVASAATKSLKHQVPLSLPHFTTSRSFAMERARECVKIGGSIKENGSPHRVMKITQGKRGKGGGFVKAKLKVIA